MINRPTDDEDEKIMWLKAKKYSGAALRDDFLQGRKEPLNFLTEIRRLLYSLSEMQNSYLYAHLNRNNDPAHATVYSNSSFGIRLYALGASLVSWFFSSSLLTVSTLVSTSERQEESGKRLEQNNAPALQSSYMPFHDC